MEKIIDAIASANGAVNNAVWGLPGLILLIGGVFTALTFYPPHIPLFEDPVTGTYGFQAPM